MVKRVNIPLDDLIRRYSDGESASALSKNYGCSVWSVINRLRKAGVEIRSAKEQNEKRLNLAPEVHERFVELVDGLLLGDGSINFKNCLYLTQTEAREQWVFHVYGLFAEIGVLTKLMWRGPREHILEGRSITEKPHRVLYSPAYVEMSDQRERWYPGGVKRVPKDIRISPLSLAHWFAGDGTFSKNGTLYFCTNGFFEEDVRFLAIRISEELGIHAGVRETRREGQFKIEILRRDDAVVFRGIILPFLSSCAHYKLQHVRPTNFGRGKGKLSEDQVRELRIKYNDGVGLKVLSADYGLSLSQVCQIGKRKSYKWVE